MGEEWFYMLFMLIRFLIGPIALIVMLAVVIFALSFRRKPFYKGLMREVPVWEEKGIVDSKQGDKILALYKLKRMHGRPRMDMVKALGLIGVLFIGIGVISFIASNWQGIAPMARTALLLAVTVATLYAGYVFSYEKKGFENLGKCLIFLSCMFWGGSIALIGQIYQVPVSDNWYIMLLWAFPILPVAIVFGNIYVLTLSSVLFLIWNFLYKVTHVPNYFYPLIVFGILLPFAAQSKLARRINILGLLIAAIVCCFFKYEWVALIIASGLLVYSYLKKEEPAFLRGSIIAFLCWVITFFVARNEAGDGLYSLPNVFFILPLWMLLRLSREHGDNAGIVMSLGAGLVWFDLLVYSFAGLFSIRYGYAGFLILQMMAAVFVYIAGVFLKIKGAGSYIVYKLFGYIVAMAAVYLFSFKFTVERLAYENDRMFLQMICGAIVFAVIGVCFAFKRGYFRKKAQYYELAGIGLVALSVAIFSCFSRATSPLLFAANAVLFMLALLNLFLGLESQMPRLFNAGVAIFALLLLTRFVDIGWSLQDKSLFFIIGGALLMAMGIFFENKRRKIVEKMRIK